MTKLSRPVRREVATIHHGPMIVTLSEEGLYFREKGRRTAFLLPYGVGYQRAVALHVAAARAAKVARRKGSR